MTSYEQPGLFPDAESSPEAGHARETRSRGVARAWLTHAQDCGGTSCDSWLRHVPVGSSARMSTGLLSINGGRDFGTVIRDLDDLGYGVAWRVLDAQWFGVPQRRRRVFIAGCLGDGAAPVEVLLEPEGGAGNPAQGGEARTGTAPAAGGGAVSALQGGGRRGYRIDAEGAAGGHLIPMPTRQVAQALTSNYGKQPDNSDTALGPTLVTSLAVAGDFSSGENVAQAVRAAHGQPGLIGNAWFVRRLSPLECERLQGLPDGWTAGQSDSARYRQLGNSVAVPVVAWITRRIAAVEHLASEAAA